ncbi:dentin sialophosphoprotein-like isoform X2 [Haliotis rufescens]|uniref:dentin sialophosphoprotein-like isoform X2 n=1 Tax=Haliotis rufescens TaxID=6454 RepID=UPI00201EB3FE|nr:dentin sialophosphoprotein-like isoform X2 [Haliotis rufescens]
MALDSNVTPNTLQSIPEEDAAMSSSIEQKPHSIPSKRVEDEDDAVIVFAHKDGSEALKVEDDLRRLKLKNGFPPRLCLYDCEKFSGSLIKSPDLLVKNCKLIFILLTNNFEHDKNCKFVLEETLAATRLEKDDSDVKKYCVRALHTQPRKCRNYTTPCGLKAIRSFDLQNEYDRGKLLDLFNYNRGLQETVHCSVQQGDLDKAPKEDQSHLDLAETNLVNDYTTMSAPPSAMTYGSKPPKQTPRAHTDRRTFSKETPNDNDINQGPDSMEAHYGSESLKKGMYTGIGEPLEPKDGVPFIDDTSTVNDPCPDLSYSMGSLCMDGKRSVVQRNGYCKSLAPLLGETDLGNSLERDTRDPTDGAASGPDQTHVQSGCPSGDAADQGGNKTDKSDTNQKTSAGTVPVGSFVCSPSSNEPEGHYVNTSNAPKPEDGEKAETSFTGDSEDIKPQKTSSISTNTTDMVREVQQSKTRDPKIQRCPHVGSASTFQGAESSPHLSSIKDEVFPTYEGTERKLGVAGASKEFPIDSSCAYITEGDTITQPVMKTNGPGHLLAPLCSSPSSEDTVLFGPHSTKGDDHNPPKPSAQEEPRHEPRSQLPHADDVMDHIVPAERFGGTPSSATYVFINHSSHIELSGDIHLVNVNAKTEFKEGNNSDKPSSQPRTKKKKHGKKLLTSGFEQTGSSGSSKSSSPSSTLKMSSIEMPPSTSPETASVCEVTLGSELVESKGVAEEPLPRQRDLMEAEEDADEPSALDTREMKKGDKSSETGCGEDCADDKSDSSEDVMKQKSKRKNTCFPFSLKRWRKKKK